MMVVGWPAAAATGGVIKTCCVLLLLLWGLLKYCPKWGWPRDKCLMNSTQCGHW